MDIAQRHVENVGKPLDKLDLSIYAQTIVVEFPFAPEGHTARLEGREAFAKFLAAIGEFTSGHQIHEVRFYPTATGFILNYTESSTFRSTSARYSSEILWIAEVKDGLIVLLREYYNPLAVLKALGDI